MADPVLSLRDVTKTFPGVTALDGVALDLYPGEVTALVGENGAGKSTIVKVLTGIYRPDGGEIRLDGRPVRFASAQDATRAGITAIHQETVLFDELSVAENIFIGHAPRTRAGLIDWPAIRTRAGEILARIDAPLDPMTPLKELGIASKHLVAIARALSVEARVVIMDEPTAALGVKESRKVLELMLDVKRRGLPIVLISHNMPHVFEVADRIHIHRLGRRIAVINPRDFSMSDAVAIMTGAMKPPEAAMAA